jgi:fatty acid desaturase
MNSLQTFREKCPRLFWVADRCLVFFVLLPSVVAFWAGIWVLLDLHFYPEDEVVGAWTCAAVGAIILVFFNVVH